MAQWHLDEIENSLNNIGWTISERIEANEKDNYIGSWVIKRGTERIVDFEGIFDGLGNTIKDPSMNKAYGCGIKDTQISLYFYKKGKMWDNELKKFIHEINELE